MNPPTALTAARGPIPAPLLRFSLILSLLACAKGGPDPDAGRALPGEPPGSENARDSSAADDSAGGSSGAGGAAGRDGAQSADPDAGPLYPGAPPASEDARGSSAPVDGAGPADADSTAADELGYLNGVVPVFVINVGGQTIPYLQDKIDGTIKVVENHSGTEALRGNQLEGIDSFPPALETRLGIEVRGNSSSGFPQRPYGIEFRDPLGEGQAVSTLGLPREADFVLHSCFVDKTCLRNAITYALARELAVPQGRWAPRTRWVEITIDGTYQGVYLLVEKIKQDRFRVSLPTPAPTAAAGDITGGYIVSSEGDVMRPPERYFLDSITGSRRWIYRFPHYLAITPEQKTYLQGAISTYLQALASRPRWADAKQITDAGSWIDFYLMQELSNNVDAYWKSWYFGKQPDAAGGRVFMGPVWDFDVAWGNVNYEKRYCATNLISPAMPNPFQSIIRDPEFANDMRCRYHELRKPGGPFDPGRIDAKIDAFAAHLARAKARDQMRWNNVGRYIYPNNYVGATWADDVRYLKYWIRKRLSWLDARLPGSCTAVPAPPLVTLIPAPAPGPDATPRPVSIPNQAPSYMPIEGAVDPARAAFACPQ